MKNKLIILAIFLLLTLVVQNYSYSEDMFNLDNKYSDENVGLGICVGMGSGLFGVYGYARPLDFIAFEAGVGYRLFLVAASDGSSLNIYTPYMFNGKLQFYFTKKQTQLQYGFELDGVDAEDAGKGAAIAGIFQYRLNHNINIDFNLGLGDFFNYKNNVQAYLINKGYDPNSIKITYVNVFLMWGGGVSFSF